MEKKLYKSKNKTIAGVCGGIAEYFGWDVSIVRIVTVILIACWGSGLLAYIVAALIIPEQPVDDGTVEGEYRDL